MNKDNNEDNDLIEEIEDREFKWTRSKQEGFLEVEEDSILGENLDFIKTTTIASVFCLMPARIPDDLFERGIEVAVEKLIPEISDIATEEVLRVVLHPDYILNPKNELKRFIKGLHDYPDRSEIDSLIEKAKEIRESMEF